MCVIAGYEDIIYPLIYFFLGHDIELFYSEQTYLSEAQSRGEPFTKKWFQDISYPTKKTSGYISRNMDYSSTREGYYYGLI